MKPICGNEKRIQPLLKPTFQASEVILSRYLHNFVIGNIKHQMQEKRKWG